jgi:adenylate cyclase
VIAGEVGSTSLGYTTIGEQVGIAQRMESVSPPGGVMLSDSTARLVEHADVLGEPELVTIKGSHKPVTVHRLLGVAADRESTGPAQPTLVGRDVELHTIIGMLDRSVSGHGCVIGVAGPAGIGKSRLVRETVALAKSRGVEVFSAFCESHTSDVPFHVAARLLRDAAGITHLADVAARAQVRAQNADANDEDLVLLYDLLGIRDPDVVLPNIDPDARRRRLTALINSVSLARTEPALYIIEDVHWIDEVSESMFSDFLGVIPHTHSVVLMTYRPEYRGALAQVTGAQTISLAPLSDSETTTLLDELLGSDPSVEAITSLIARRAVGNPFFAQEMVRELAERGVLEGDRGGYTCRTDVADVSVPATLQATIAARIDRLDPGAKKAINAAAVIGSRFTPELLAALGIDPVLDDLVRVEMIDQVRFTPYPEYGFHHPLIRAVAYESQLKSERAEMHRRLATAIEQRQPDSVEKNAALIAENLEAAGELRAAFNWHMRAGTWLAHGSITGARASWQRARDVADRLPDADPDGVAMRIAPRTMLCVTAWFAGGSMSDTGFDELHDLAAASGDKVSLAMGMAGWVSALLVHARFREASRLASELTSLLDSIGDPSLTLGLLYAAFGAKFEVGEMAEVVRLAQLAIDLADGDARKGSLITGSPLITAITFRGCARCCLGNHGWEGDIDTAMTMVGGAFEPTTPIILLYKNLVTVPHGVVLPDAAALQETAELLATAQRSSDDYTLACAQFVHGVTLVSHDGPQRGEGFALLAAVREAALHERFTMLAAAMIDTFLAQEKASGGDCDGAIELSRTALEQQFAFGDKISISWATAVLVEALLSRRDGIDLHEAQVAIDRLEAVPTEPGFVMNHIWLLRLRALLAQAQGDEDAYRDYRDRYRAMAKSLGFEGHMKWAEAMP